MFYRGIEGYDIGMNGLLAFQTFAAPMWETSDVRIAAWGSGSRLRV